MDRSPTAPRPAAHRWFANAAARRATHPRASRRRSLGSRCDLFGKTDRGNVVMRVVPVRVVPAVLACVGLAAVTPRVAGKAPLAATPFPLQQVRLLHGPFRQARLLAAQSLLGLDPDRLLHNFRVNAGLPSSAKPLGGWEAPDVELRGHSVGHYLSALALMYASTGDSRFKERADLMVAELGRIQDAQAKRFHPGYLSAFPEEFFDRVESRQKVWAPYYTIHKIMAGLLDVAELCGNAEARKIVTGMADWVAFRVDRISEEQQQRALDP